MVVRTLLPCWGRDNYVLRVDRGEPIPIRLVILFVAKERTRAVVGCGQDLRGEQIIIVVVTDVVLPGIAVGVARQHGPSVAHPYPEHHTLLMDTAVSSFRRLVADVIGDVLRWREDIACLLYTSPSPRDRTR